LAETSRFSLNDNSSDDRYPSGSTLAFPKIGLDKVLVIEVDNDYRRHLTLSGSYQTVGDSLSFRYPDVSKSGDRDTGETILEITSIGNLVPAPTYANNPINKYCAFN
jgi:hypothetical protein